MKKSLYILILFLVVLSCNSQAPTQFSESALNDNFVTLNGDDIAFKNIIKAYENKTIVIEIWASWCGDCLKGMPKVKALQNAFPETTYVFLSLDKNQEAWKRGIEKYKIEGNHYFMKSGWDGPFGEFVKLDWIPRYMVVDAQGNIKVFKAINADDETIKKSLK
jgi:thiol-disulfide isomerase/thioredoxin